MRRVPGCSDKLVGTDDVRRAATDGFQYCGNQLGSTYSVIRMVETDESQLQVVFASLKWTNQLLASVVSQSMLQVPVHTAIASCLFRVLFLAHAMWKVW